MLVSRFGEIELKMSPVIEAILSHRNVHLRTLNLNEFSIGTPFEDFIQSGELLESKFIVTHTSDVLRLLLLWSYGGTYLDSDVIVRRRLDSVPANFVCDDVANTLNGAVVNFDVHKNNSGELAERFIENMIEKFNGSVWGSNGPLLFTRVLTQLCHTKNTLEMVKIGNCQGFHVLPRQYCYPVPGVSWEKFFDESQTKDVMTQVKNSLVVHFWNNLSKKTHLRADSSAAYTQLARKFCPKVIESCGEFFD